MRFLLVILLLFSLPAYAQEDTLIYEVQDVEPEFPGGFSEMLQWVQNSLTEIIATEEEKICLSNIFIEFVVEKDGTLSNIKARNKCNSDLSHFIALLEKSPKWTPGFYQGNIIRSRCRVPLQIHLE